MNRVLSKTGRRVFLKNIFPVTFFSHERDYVSKLGAAPSRNWHHTLVPSKRNFKVITVYLL